MEDNGNPEDTLEIVRGVMGRDENVMFTIERDFNRNVCYYSTQDGVSVDAKWLLIPDDIDLHDMSIEQVEDELVEEPLTRMETYAYGTKSLGQGRFMLNAIKGEQLGIRRDQEGNYRATIFIQGIHWTLRRIMIHTKPALGMLYPSVTEIHLEVEDVHGDIAQFFYAA